MSTKTRELKGEDYFVCQDCLKETDDFYLYSDSHYGLTICEDCFNIRFGRELASKNLDWFTNNFNKEDYPDSFWSQF